MSLLNRLFGRGPATSAAAAFPPPRPAEPFHAIGDVHGCLDLLEVLVDQIDTVAPDAPLICVGDLVDRGDNSAGVLRFLMDRQARRPAPLVCLAGNHENMLLRFLDAPEDGERWLRHGGLQTLESFGVQLGFGQQEDPLTTLRDALAEAMGPEMIRWLQSLPTQWVSGNVAVVHAGADPFLPIDAQRTSVLMWGHPAFARQIRPDGIWVVHGHTVVDQPTVGDGRVGIDTGAYSTGRLTAVRAGPDGFSFLTADGG